MTGTANEFYDYNESSNMDLFSAWLFGRINANCLLSDISRCGCSVLIPKKQSAPSENFKLLIMCPDDNEKLYTVLKVGKCWENNDYSSTHQKIGIKFINVDHDQLNAIDVLEKHFKLSVHATIKCSLLKS